MCYFLCLRCPSPDLTNLPSELLGFQFWMGCREKKKKSYQFQKTAWAILLLWPNDPVYLIDLSNPETNAQNPSNAPSGYNPRPEPFPQHCRCAISQERRICSCHCTIGLDECRFYFGHLLQEGQMPLSLVSVSFSGTLKMYNIRRESFILCLLGQTVQVQCVLTLFQSRNSKAEASRSSEWYMVVLRW